MWLTVKLDCSKNVCLYILTFGFFPLLLCVIPCEWFWKVLRWNMSSIWETLDLNWGDGWFVWWSCRYSLDLRCSWGFLWFLKDFFVNFNQWDFGGVGKIWVNNGNCGILSGILLLHKPILCRSAPVSTKILLIFHTNIQKRSGIFMSSIGTGIENHPVLVFLGSLYFEML